MPILKLILYPQPLYIHNTNTGQQSYIETELTKIYKVQERMIQELLGGASLIGGGRKITILEGTVTTPSPSPSPSPSSSSSTTTTTSAPNPTTSTTSSENLRCPRCDSSNTKFCYYNNYNLTQPRHFCKTCRRYWTKGGALRNVPIGGGCRKSKSTSVPTSVGKSSTCKIKTVSSAFERSGFDFELPSSPVLWTSPQNSHFLALLRSTSSQNPNPNPNPSFLSSSVKEEGGLIGTHIMTEPAVVSGAVNARTLGLDHALSQVSSLGLCSPGLCRNSQSQGPQQHHQANGFIVGHHEAQNNSGMQELYQRLRASTPSYYTDNSAVGLSNNVGSLSLSSSSSTILEAAPVVGGHEFGYWNPAFSSWSDLPTTNGAYP